MDRHTPRWLAGDTGGGLEPPPSPRAHDPLAGEGASAAAPRPHPGRSRRRAAANPARAEEAKPRLIFHRGRRQFGALPLRPRVSGRRTGHWGVSATPGAATPGCRRSCGPGRRGAAGGRSVNGRREGRSQHRLGPKRLTGRGRLVAVALT